VKFWGIGNESWGCGGNMTPEFYADNYCRYSTYARNYGDAKVFKIACGPSDSNYEWTKVLMEKTCGPRGPMLEGLSLHYYVFAGGWDVKGSATLFNEQEWLTTMKKSYFMDELITKHDAIMNQYDPQKKVGLVVDEWGNWFDVESGTNPGFLYQQNTLRDALVAGSHFNIFNNHADRVYMANIAQTINVLQSVILTEGGKMLLTPTYHAFDMYKVHQDAVKLPVFVESETVAAIPAISASASVDNENRIHVSLTNIDPRNTQKVTLELRGAVKSGTKVTGTIITSENMQDHNTFDKTDKVKLGPFTDAVVLGSNVVVTLPSKSVVTLEIV
jgi:alpha-N-arabinofuranosidase